MKLDFAKAYDKVDLSFLFSVISKLGIPDSFILLTRFLYLAAKACININGKNSRSFTIDQEVCQGCPLAPYLFLIVGETLNRCIKVEARVGKILGIQLHRCQKQQIMMQYAKDTSLTIGANQKLVSNTFSLILTFNQGSGLIINW